MRRFLQIIAIIILTTLSVYSQREYFNWYFGNRSGVTFNTPNNEPDFILGNSIVQFEGTATISNPTGNLLIYSNGEFVLNKLHEVINVGNPLYGHQSSSQSAVIFPAPGSNNLYYIFTADAGEYTGETNRGINYSIVDINGNNGRGSLAITNSSLLAKSCEQLTATYHANGRDIWVVARGWNNNNFYAYLVTDNGISDTVITQIGFARSTDLHTIGCMKFSPNGSVAAIPVYDEQFFEMYRFDNKSGEFFDRLQIDMPEQFTLYGMEFSSNGKVLYVTSSKNGSGFYSVFQFNVANYSKSSIENSGLLLSYRNGHIGSLQRGPNNKIYAALLSEPFIASIESPNTLGSDARFIPTRVFLQDSLSQLGLPQSLMVPNNYRSFAVCEGTDLILDTDEFLFDTIRYESIYKWEGPNGYVSFAPKPALNNIRLTDSGNYVLTATYLINSEPLVTSYTINIQVGAPISFSLVGTDSICAGSIADIASDTLNPNFAYLWSTGSRNSRIFVSESGTYKLTITTQFGCVDSAFFNLLVMDPPKVEIGGDKLICNNQVVELFAVNKSNSYKYLWSTGDTTSSIFVNNPGIYKLIVSNEIGCKDSAFANVVAYPELNVSIKGDTVWCSGESAKLFADVTPFDSTLKYDFSWSTGEKTSEITVSKTGIYILTVTIENKCIYRDTINIIKSDSPIILTNLSTLYELCDGEYFMADLTQKDSSVIYKWDDGFLNFPRRIDKAGEYKIIALGPSGCTSDFRFKVNYFPKPKAEILLTDDVNICTADSIILSAYPKDENLRYLWLNNGSTDEELIVRNSGLYFLVVTNEFGCSDTSSISIEFGKGLPLRISGRANACMGEKLTLTANVNFAGNSMDFKYLWSNGDTTKSISVEQSGLYYVTVSHSSGCEGKDSVIVRFYNVPDITLNYPEKHTICRGDSILVSPTEINNDWNYFWSDNNFSLPRVFSQAGIYKLYAVNAGTCIDSVEFELDVIEAPFAKIEFDGDLKICKNESLILKIGNYDDSFNYEWSDGSSEKTFEVDKTGTYYLFAKNDFGCSAKDSITILEASEPTLNLALSDAYLCFGDSLRIIANGDFSRIIWDNGTNDKEIIINKAGVFRAAAFSEDNCMTVDSINVEYFSEPVIISANDIDFGIICPGINEENEFVITNNSNFDINISNYFLNGDDEFSISEIPIGTILKSGETLELSVNFFPIALGQYNAELTLYYKHFCKDSLTIRFIGWSDFSSTISLPELSMTSGDSVCIPINFRFDCIEEVNFNSSANIKIQFDAAYFMPEYVTNGQLIRNEILNGTRFLEIRINDTNYNSKEGVLTYICGRAMIGYDTLSPIIINYFNWSEPINARTQNGTFISEACLIDFRQIKYFKPTSININPNPVIDFMKVNVISEEKGIFALDLVTSAGITLFSEKWTRNENESAFKDIIIQTRELSSGVYMLKLTSPWSVKSSVVVIVK